MTDMSFPQPIENTEGLNDIAALTGWLTADSAELKTRLSRDGALLFRGFPVTSAEDFDAFSAAFGYGDFTYAESLSNAVRINHTPRVFTANEAPPDVEIFLHHEMAQTPIYPQKIFFCCLSPAEVGGATPICRSDLLYAAFQADMPEWANQFEGLGLKYTTQMPDDDDPGSGQGRSWRSTLSVDSRKAAEARLKSLGYSWSWLPDDMLLATTPALPAVRTLSDGSESFFNQVIAAYKGWHQRDTQGDPLLTFGNGEEIPGDVLASLTQLAGTLTVPLQWQAGDVALIDNYRVMHGRYPYSGSRKRQVLVSLATE